LGNWLFNVFHLRLLSVAEARWGVAVAVDVAIVKLSRLRWTNMQAGGGGTRRPVTHVTKGYGRSRIA
jgi:hypothetical protein